MRLSFSERFKKEFRKFDKYTQENDKSLDQQEPCGNRKNPRLHGKGLPTANRSGQWRYRIGDYRLICNINDNKLIILALSVGHRRDVNKKSI